MDSKNHVSEAPTFGDDVVASLRDFVGRRQKGEPLTVRTLRLDLEPAQYLPEDVKHLRSRLGVSQAVFARLMAVSVKLVQHWEQGERHPQPIARRLMDEMRCCPAHWRARLRSGRSVAKV